MAMFGKPKPAGPGHRGLGLGLKSGKPKFGFGGKGTTWPEQDQPVDTVVSADEAELFLQYRKPMPVYSSNVGHLVQWVAEAAYPFLVQFHGGSGQVQATWAYKVSEDMVRDFLTAPSKGTWIWDHIRVRGPGNVKKHQVPAMEVSGLEPELLPPGEISTQAHIPDNEIAVQAHIPDNGITVVGPRMIPPGEISVWSPDL